MPLVPKPTSPGVEATRNCASGVVRTSRRPSVILYAGGILRVKSGESPGCGHPESGPAVPPADGAAAPLPVPPPLASWESGDREALGLLKKAERSITSPFACASDIA